jgi:hypothetical protein
MPRPPRARNPLTRDGRFISLPGFPAWRRGRGGRVWIGLRGLASLGGLRERDVHALSAQQAALRSPLRASCWARIADEVSRGSPGHVGWRRPGVSFEPAVSIPRARRSSALGDRSKGSPFTGPSVTLVLRARTAQSLARFRRGACPRGAFAKIEAAGLPGASCARGLLAV